MTASTVRLPSGLDLAVDEQGAGRPIVVLHGGGGPATVAPIAAHLAVAARTLTPTLPGWNGTPRPERIARVEQIADELWSWIEKADLRDVALVGSSIGGWLAAELAVRDARAAAHRITAVALIDSMGFDLPGHPIRDFFALDARGVAEHSFHDAERFYRDPATIPDEQKRAMAANLATMRVVAGDPYMVNPGLLADAATVTAPTLVLWGDSDGIADADYGRAVAAAFPAGRFELIERAGHLPQLERPEATFAALDAFLAEVTAAR